MRTIHLTVLAGLAVSGAAVPALAEDVIHVTPPLYREQARTAGVRPASELATIPHPVAPARAIPRIVAEAAPPSR